MLEQRFCLWSDISMSEYPYILTFSSLNSKEKHKKESEEIREIKTEMNNTSMQDEFPKYARLQRKLNKLIDDEKLKEKTLASSQLRTSMLITHGIQFAMTVVSLTLFWVYRSSPVLFLPEAWIYPLGNVLSWPTYVNGVISFPVWFLMTNSVAKIIVGS